MKTPRQTLRTFWTRSTIAPVSSKSTTPTIAEDSETNVSPQQARRILISLMVTSTMMVLTFSMSGVALPIMRDAFQVQVDVAAWIPTVFALPFMILMPVYGRLSDGVGKRRLLLGGIIIFSIGTAIIINADGLPALMIGRAVQGVGTAGLMPLAMAMISAIFPASERGKALGTWSSVGPTVGFLSPLAAGFIIDAWGWRASFVPPLIMGVVAFVVVARGVPAGLSQIKPNFLRSFDWGGVGLFSVSITMFLFYLSSRPVTGVASLRDWRLLTATIVLFTGFLLWERQHHRPFVDLGIYRNRMFSLASFCGAMRMFTMAGVGFLVPLYLVDIHGLTAIYIGGALMISPGAMVITTRFGGQLADRLGSRWPVMIGLTVQTSVMIIFSRLPATTSLWVIGLILFYHGLGAGLVLAALHRAALGSISDGDLGIAAGLYSMVRFAGAVIGTALGGVILQQYLDRGFPVIEAYQVVFLFFAGLAVVGLVAAFGLREQKTLP